MSEETNTESAAPVAEKSDDMISKANKVAERLEAANAKTQELLDRQEALAVKKTFGGESTVEHDKPKEESPKEYAKRVLEGDL